MQQLGLDQLRFEYNPDRARQLLAEAGFAGGFEINMYEVPTCSSAAVVTSEAISGMLREIGLTVNELKSPDSTVRPLRVDRTMKGIQVIGGCGPTPREPLTSLGLYWTVDSAFNYGFEHPTYQDLVNAALDEQDLEERWAIQGEIIKFLYDEVMTIPLYQETLLFPLGPELDTWTRAGSAVPQAYLSNWEYAPHRQ